MFGWRGKGKTLEEIILSPCIMLTREFKAKALRREVFLPLKTEG